MNWKGVFPALTTKFTSSDLLDFELFDKNLQFQIESGVHGVILGGTLGESSVLNDEEKEKLVRFTLERVKSRIPVIINIAEGSTKMAVQMAENALKWGADGLMMLPPMRYKADDRENIEFFSTVASNTSLPIMIYNNPVDYKNEVTLDMFEILLNKHKNIQAVKESTRDVSNVTRMKHRFGDRLSILCGVDTLAMEELVMGADGWVAGLVCAFPAETMAIYNSIQEGNIEKARQIYTWFLPLLELDIHPKLVQYIKMAETLCGIGSEFVRAPRLVLIGEERERVVGIIHKGITSRPNLFN